MTKYEEIITFYALSFLADKLDIKEDEIIKTKNNKIKFNKILEENKGVYKDKDIKQDVINMINKFINKLSDDKKKREKKGE